MVKRDMRDTIYYCIANILDRENKEYAKLSEIYEEVATYLEVENNYSYANRFRSSLFLLLFCEFKHIIIRSDAHAGWIG